MFLLLLLLFLWHGLIGLAPPKTEWLLLARSKREMKDWMEAITDQIHALFIREYSIPGDDYRNEG